MPVVKKENQPGHQASKLRAADDIFTFFMKAAFENKQIGKAVSVMGSAQNLKKEEDVIVARGVGATSVQSGLRQAKSQELFAGSSKTTARYLGSRLTWKMSFAKEMETRIAAASNAWRMLGELEKSSVNFKFECNVFKSTDQGALHSGLCAFAGQNGSFTRNTLFPVEAGQNRWRADISLLTRRDWDSEPKQRHTANKDVHRNLGMVSIAMELRSRRLGWTKRLADACVHQASFSEDFLGKHEGTRTPI